MHSNWRARLVGVDWFAPLCAAVAVVVYATLGLDGPLSRDLGVYAYAGQQVADGVAPYLGILNRCGPLAHLIPGAGVAVARLVGGDDVVGVRVLFLLLAATSVGVTYLLGRDLFRTRLAGLAAAAALLCFEGFIRLAAGGPREKSAMVLFLVVALLAVVHRRWAAAGFFIALGALTWQPVFPAALAGAVAAALVGLSSGRLRALAGIAVGGLVPAALTAGAYAAIGELQVFLDNFLLINARYTTQRGFLSNPGDSWRQLAEGYGASLTVLVVGVVALLVLTAVALGRRTSRRDPRTAGLVAAGVALVVATLWTTLRAFNNWPDAFVILPLAAVGIGGLAGELRRRLPLRAAVVVTVTWVLVATSIAMGYSLTTRDDRLPHQRASVAAALAVVPDAQILSIEAPEALVLAGQRNPARIQLFGAGLLRYLDDTWPGGADGFGRWVTDEVRPELIAMGRQRGLWLRPHLSDSYARVGRGPTWVWYLRSDVPEDTRDALHLALRAAHRGVQG
jgi:hypothetical protein